MFLAIRLVSSGAECFVCNMNENENWGMQGAVVGLGARAAEVRQRILLPESENSSYL